VAPLVASAAEFPTFKVIVATLLITQLPAVILVAVPVPFQLLTVAVNLLAPAQYAA